ncbi:MAG: chromosome segregation protein SMC [Alphaproteobacteria bacterium]|nr:chromosome segregation protein SMC [Alphaproteobacteria bacterium]
MFFSRLQLHGFKSFVDETEILIDAGLTGIVGPNGCGKSNLVEALRWVMGESSARSLRGGDMDDVIFGGTNQRASRNLAEVILTIDNRDRSAPVVINDSDQIEISRKITRGQGSNYRINGKEIRAKDVQLLFADASTGAHSPSLVSQGKISALISMRPVERRVILEDAAGIGGLYARRHEAELKLANADSNLLRVDDQIQALEAVLHSLHKQVKLVLRYRELGESIRQSEARLLWLEWQAAQAERQKGLVRIREAESTVVARQLELAARTREQTELAARLPSCRQEATLAGEALHQLMMESRDYEAGVTRRSEKKNLLDNQCELIARDQNRELELSADARRELQRLSGALAEISQDNDLFGNRLSEARTQLETVETKLKTAQTDWQEAQRNLSGLEARRGDWQRRGQVLHDRRGQLSRQQQELQAQKQRLAGTEAEIAAVSREESRLLEREQAANAAAEAVTAAQQSLTATQPAVAAAEAELARLNGQVSQLRGQRQGVMTALQSLNRPAARAAAAAAPASAICNPPIIAGLTIASGWENAVAAALGDELLDGIIQDQSAANGWLAGGVATAPDFSNLSNVTPLSHWISVTGEQPLPAGLQLALAAVATVEEDASGWQQWRKLGFGQRLVAKSGRAWRYDGFFRAGLTTQAAATSTLAAAERQKRELQASLTELDAQIAIQGAEIEERNRDLQGARQARSLAETSLGAANNRLAQARREVAEVTQSLHDLRLKTAENRTRLAALNEAFERFNAENEALARQEKLYLDEPNPTPELNQARDIHSQKQSAISAAQTEREQARRNLETRQREVEVRQDKRAALTRDIESWQGRTANTEQRLAELQQRLNDTMAEIEEIKNQTIVGLDRRQELAERITAAEAVRAMAQEKLLASEKVSSQAEVVVKKMEQSYAAAKEEHIRAQAMQQSLDQNSATIAEKSLEKLQLPIDRLAALAEAENSAENLTESLPQLRQKLERLLRERDGLGPINLRAEVEAADYESQLGLLLSEKSDLVAAIAKLRQAINDLNRDGSQRLIAAFAQVNETFTRLFESLFGGGKAYLQLTENEDPLAAGLDIFASPPGKKLQNLSLMSGGEQALTALALIFAVFLTKPSPICVLDEVDAPLDDANVDRFCGLLSQIAASSGTRFLVITHHRLTMARMDRLYGVTMAERGISQLVSVDLAHAERIKERA